jgi:molybdopterin converting factor small subunit
VRRLKVTLRLGRAFAKEAGFSERVLPLPETQSAVALLRAIAAVAPSLSCVDHGTVDLAVAHLSINGKAVDPRAVEGHAVNDGDSVYLYAPISGG